MKLKTDKGIIDVELVKENNKTIIVKSAKKQIKLKKGDSRIIVESSERSEELHNAN